jgi:hypothetical protein
MWTVFMPSLPKVGWISGQEWARKIKRKLKAQQLCATASDVSVAGEIKKDLHEECETSRLRRDQARVCRRIIEYSLDTTANRSANTIFGFTERLKPLAETFANGES